MCVMSAVYDHFNPLFPPEAPWIPDGGTPFFPPPAWPTITTTGSPAVTVLASEIEALRKLIADFRAAVQAAAVIDRVTGKTDCVDPEKRKLDARVAALETKLAELDRRSASGNVAESSHAVDPAAIEERICSLAATWHALTQATQILYDRDLEAARTIRQHAADKLRLALGAYARAKGWK